MKIPENLHIRQKTEGLEAFTGIETRNQYSIKNEEGEEIGYAAENSGGTMRTILRLIYSKGRPLEIEITDKEGNLILTISKGIHFFFPHYEIKNPEGETIVKAKARFSILKKIIDIVDENDEILFTSKASAFKIGSIGFSVYRGEKEKAKITKKWSGIGKETFTDAENFHVQFTDLEDQKWRKVFTAFAFAIDLTFFERG